MIVIESYLPTNFFQEENTKGNVTEYQPNVIMRGLSPSNYVLHAFTNVHTNDLEQTLQVL
jgi:U3 small nucleolar RNA-associated protein 12